MFSRYGNQNEWDENTKLAVWQKGFVDLQYNSNIYRKDRFGTWMKYSDHGNRNSDYGWEIDHIIPVSKGGMSVMSNLQPLHWQNNVNKSNN